MSSVSLSNPFPWPPPYILRHSSRARSVRVHICAQRGLLLIVPRRFNPNRATAVLEEHRQWIERTWLRIQPRTQSAECDVLPQQLQFLAVDELWHMSYYNTCSERLVLKAESPPPCGGRNLSISGNTQNFLKVKSTLQRWLQRQAQHHLIPWLRQLAAQNGFFPAQVTIRNASTRWGSCTAHKNISLNTKLLFLPAHLVEYVMLHELCHTIHLDHSKRFWNLLQQVNPNCHQHRQALSKAHFYIPPVFCKDHI